ncbi:MAG: PEGA domain-containing protein [bacterium]|nr:PEGA domain-containing protein [bacterium]
MSRHQPPFHRRILPWLFFIIFLALAPVLILYTAGYRYNPKKNALERNGTLIVDTSPAGASIVIDGQDTKTVSPITFQNVAPGLHQVVLSKSGYHTWNQRIDVRAEQVSFANHIFLWRQSEPALTLAGPFIRATADPLNQKLAIISQTPTALTLGYWSPSSGLVAQRPLVNATNADLQLRWRADGGALLIGGNALTASAWWSALDAGKPFVEALPSALYHWAGDFLRGNDASMSYQIDPKSRTLTRELLFKGAQAQTDNYSLQTTSTGVLLIQQSLRKRVYSLPTGKWYFGDLHQPYLLLRDAAQWLVLDPTDLPVSEQATGDYPRWLHNSDNALFLNRGEIWLWHMGNSPELLWRQSEPILQAVWHREGRTIFVADEHQIFALSLDNRNGRVVTPLADFDRIDDMGMIGKVLFIAGTKNETQGLWKLEVE